MSKVEKLGFVPPPIPSPQQLKNSIKALEAFHPYDARIERYRAMLPKAVSQRSEWEKEVDRLKSIIGIRK